MQYLPFHPFPPRQRNATLGVLLIGASFLLPASAFVAFYGYALLAMQISRPNDFVFNWLLALLVVYVLPVATKRLFHIGAAMRMPDAIEMLNTDNRAPILYLRSFEDDGVADLTTQIIPWSPTQTVEMRVSQALGELGPVVSIGRPGERLPELGANRFYVSNAEWKDAVLYFLKCSSAVVIVVGRTTGVSWEIRTALESVPPEKLLLVFPYLLPKQERTMVRRIKELIRKGNGKTDLVTAAMLSDLRKERDLRYRFFCKEFADTIPSDMPSLPKEAVFIDFLSDGFPRLLTTCQPLLIRRYRDQQSLTIDYRRSLRPFIEKLSRHPVPPGLVEKVLANRSTLQMFTVVCLICLVATYIGMWVGGGPFSLAGAVAGFISLGLFNLLYWSICDLRIMARPRHETTKDNHRT